MREIGDKTRVERVEHKGLKETRDWDRINVTRRGEPKNEQVKFVQDRDAATS